MNMTPSIDMNRLLACFIKPRIFIGIALLAVLGAVLVYLSASGKLEPWAAYLDSDAMSIEVIDYQYIGQSRRS